MNKEHLFKEIRQSVEQGSVTRDEIVSYAESLPAASAALTSEPRASGDRHRSGSSHEAGERNSLVAKVLYVIGGVIALSGILVFLGNNWYAMGFLGRWLVTVGIGLVSFCSAFLTYRRADLNVLTQVFFSISAVALYIGGIVWLSEATPIDLTGAEGVLLVSGILLVVFAVALYAARKAVLHVIASAFFTIAYYALIFKLLDGTYFSGDGVKDILAYSTMILGLGYLAYGSWIRSMSGNGTAGSVKTMLEAAPRVVQKLFGLYALFAFTFVLLGGLFLGGIWNVLYAFLVIGAISLSIRLRSTIALVVSAVSVGIYCIKISVQYFSDSLSFSLVLLMSGLLVIALGYLTYYLNRKYISR